MRDRTSSVNTEATQASSTVLFDVWLTARLVITMLDEALAGTGLGAEDFAVYSVLRKAGEISPTELARWMSAPATTVSSYIKRLEARKHVRRVPNPDDRRSYRLRLTKAGERAHAAAGRLFIPTQEGVENAMTMPTKDVQDALRELRRAVADYRGLGEGVLDPPV
jgi:DNA-binding MarR family transcriptional regulator